MRNLINYARNRLSSAFALWLHGCQPTHHRKLGIFKADGIGDFVLSSEAIRWLIAKHGPGEVSLIVSHQVYDLAAEYFPGVEILPIAPGHSGLGEKVRHFPYLRSATSANFYDEVVCLRHYRTFYENTILRTLQAKRVVLLTNQSLGGARTELTPIPKNFCYVRAEVEISPAGQDGIPREWSFHAAVLSASLGQSVSPESLRPEWDVHKTHRGISAPFMLVSPLAGRNIRDLPLRLVQAAVRRAFVEGLAKVIVTGSRQQAAQLSYYADALRADLPGCAVQVAHPTNLPALVRLVAGAALVLTAETSTAHLAAALDQPALILIGGGHYGWFAPWQRSAKQVWLTNQLPCFDCNWRCPYPEPFCLTRIAVSDIEAAIRTARQS